MVATALTVYGIETTRPMNNSFTIFVATALTVYGIETSNSITANSNRPFRVATALTVYGIETP